MSIQKLIISNFKGVQDRHEFEIRPLTIFCGPNSSGKSSCIHALAALAQTTKLSASQMPIVLDDENAQVHLGRFLDVLHSKQIKDSFSIGVCIDNPGTLVPILKNQTKKPPELSVEFAFKARPTTQEIYLQSAYMSMGDGDYRFERKTSKSSEYDVYLSGKKQRFDATSIGRFGIQIYPAYIKDSAPKPDELDGYMLTQYVNRNLSIALSQTYYLGPFRQGPLRKYPTRGSQPTEVGPAGESAVTMLANEFARSKSKHPNLAQVSAWFGQLGLGKKLSVLPVGKTDLVDVSVTLTDGAQLPLPDLGFGVSQVLPVLVQCAFAKKNATLLFEQPELHLHEKASRQLAGVFVDVVKNQSAQIIAETHSRELFHELIQEVRKGRISPEEVVLYDVSRQNGASTFKKITISKDSTGHCEVDHPWGNGLED